MAGTKQIDVKTENKTFGKIEVQLEVSVPENVQEAAEFYGGEEKMIDAIQQDVARRRANAARPILRDSETKLDWQKVAQEAASTYTPGRRGGFAPSIDESELRNVGDMDSLIALLRSRGVNLSGAASDTDAADETEQDDADALNQDEALV